MSDPSERNLAEQKPLLKLAIEIGPLVAFFIAQRQLDIFYATGIFMGAMVISVTAARRMEGRWPVMPLVTLVFVLIMGGLTLWLGDEDFIKLKPTITNLCFAVILAGGLLADRLFLKMAFGEAFQLTEIGWKKLTWNFAGFFVFLAILNEVVRRTFSTDDWTTFKVFGIMPLTFVFMVSQAPLLKKHSIEPSDEPEPPND